MEWPLLYCLGVRSDEANSMLGQIACPVNVGAGTVVGETGVVGSPVLGEAGANQYGGLLSDLDALSFGRGHPYEIVMDQDANIIARGIARLRAARSTRRRRTPRRRWRKRSPQLRRARKLGRPRFPVQRSGREVGHSLQLAVHPL